MWPSLVDGWAGQTQTFGYDFLDRLTSAKALGGSNTYTQTYGFDAIGNFKALTDTTSGSTVTNYAYGSGQPHAVTSLTTGTKVANQVYNADGNQTRRVVLSGSSLITYTQSWDPENRLSTVTNTVSGDVTWFRYDADGQRVKRIVSVGGVLTSTIYIGNYMEADIPGNTGGMAHSPDRQLGQTQPASAAGAVKGLERPLLTASWSLQIDNIGPGTNRKIGETVIITASATNVNNGGLDSIWFYVNCDAAGATTGAWWTLGSVAVSGTSASASYTLNPAGPNTCGASALAGTHAVVVNAKLGAGATTGDWFDTSSNRWWIVWTANTATRKQTVFWGNPPTGAVSGATSILRGTAHTYTGTAADADGNLSNLKIYVSPTGGASWTQIGNTTTCSGGSCSGAQSWTPSATGTYYVLVNVTDGTSLNCTGNYNAGNDLWGNPLGAGWYDCGANDKLTVTVTVSALPGPPAGQTWRYYYYAGARRIAVRTRVALTDTLQYLFTDQLGSTSVAANPDGTGAIRQSYYPWGKVRSAGALPTDHQFTGAAADSTGLI